MHDSEYWLRFFLLDSQVVVKICYKWQLNNFSVESGVKKLKGRRAD